MKLSVSRPPHHRCALSEGRQHILQRYKQYLTHSREVNAGHACADLLRTAALCGHQAAVTATDPGWSHPLSGRLSHTLSVLALAAAAVASLRTVCLLAWRSHLCTHASNHYHVMIMTSEHMQAQICNVHIRTEESFDVQVYTRHHRAYTHVHNYDYQQLLHREQRDSNTQCLVLRQRCCTALQSCSMALPLCMNMHCWKHTW